MMDVSATLTTQTPPAKADGTGRASAQGNEVDSPDAKGFGHVLAQRMDTDGKTDAAGPGERSRQARADTTQAAATGKEPAAGATDDGKTSAADAIDKSPVDPAGNDLAAQLALVSQWAALPPSTAAAKAVDAAAGGDIKVKFDAARGKAATAKDLIAKTGDDATERAIGEAGTTIDAALAKVEAIGSHAQATTTNLANGFVTQVAAQVPAIVDSPSTPAAASVPPTISLREQVGTSAWAHEVGSATLRMAAGDLQSASLRLAPEHLGPVDVQLRIDNGVANVTFTASHAETRQALEASRTTLDQMFSDQGIRLGDCAVGDFASSRQGFDANASRPDGVARAAAGSGSEADSGTSIVTTRVTRALGLVDTFA